MKFELKTVVPWGRNFSEYKAMFNLNNFDLQKKIISFGDGPASFNCEMNKLEYRVTSIDPIYTFNVQEIKKRISETKDIIIEQVTKNKNSFNWTFIKSIDELIKIRLTAMNEFLNDFTVGNKSRYISHRLPDKTSFEDCQFDLGLSSHFLILYSDLGLDFHIKSIREMMRICKEIRIFPLLNLNNEKPPLLKNIMQILETEFHFEIHKVNYEFQKGANEFLKVLEKTS